MFTMFMSMYKNFKKKTLWTEHVDAVDRLKHVDLTTLLKLLVSLVAILQTSNIF